VLDRRDFSGRLERIFLIVKICKHLNRLIIVSVMLILLLDVMFLQLVTLHLKP